MLEQKVEKQYDQICFKAEALSLEVEQGSNHKCSMDYIEELNQLQIQYIRGFQEMDSSQRADAHYLLIMLQSQIHGRLDVLRAKLLSGALRRKTKKDWIHQYCYEMVATPSLERYDNYEILKKNKLSNSQKKWINLFYFTFYVFCVI